MAVNCSVDSEKTTSCGRSFSSVILIKLSAGLMLLLLCLLVPFVGFLCIVSTGFVTLLKEMVTERLGGSVWSCTWSIQAEYSIWCDRFKCFYQNLLRELMYCSYLSALGLLFEVLGQIVSGNLFCCLQVGLSVFTAEDAWECPRLSCYLRGWTWGKWEGLCKRLKTVLTKRPISGH